MPRAWKAVKDMVDDLDGKNNLESFVSMVSGENVLTIRTPYNHAIAIKNVVLGMVHFRANVEHMQMTLVLGMKDEINNRNEVIFDHILTAVKLLATSKRDVTEGGSGSARAQEAVESFVFSAARLVATVIMNFMQKVLKEITYEPTWEHIMSSGHEPSIKEKFFKQEVLDVDQWIGAANLLWGKFSSFTSGIKAAVAKHSAFLAAEQAAQSALDKHKSFSASVGALSLIYLEMPPLATRTERAEEKVKCPALYQILGDSVVSLCAAAAVARGYLLAKHAWTTRFAFCAATDRLLA